jgi:hypothetical protein
MFSIGFGVRINRGRYLDSHQAATYIGYSLSGLMKMLASGKGPRHRGGGQKGKPLLFAPEDLDAWLAAQQHGGQLPPMPPSKPTKKPKGHVHPPTIETGVSRSRSKWTKPPE